MRSSRASVVTDPFSAACQPNICAIAFYIAIILQVDSVPMCTADYRHEGALSRR